MKNNNHLKFYFTLPFKINPEGSMFETTGKNWESMKKISMRRRFCFKMIWRALHF